MIKRFSSMAGKKRESAKVVKAKALIASVRNLDSEISKTDQAVNQVYASFSDPNRKFTDSQVKKTIIAFSKMDHTLEKFFKKSYANLKVAVANELPCERISSQIEDLASLRAKLAILRAQAASSLGLEDEEIEEDLIEIDEAGYEVATDSVGDIFAEIGEEANEANEAEGSTEANEAEGSTEASTEANEAEGSTEANEASTEANEGSTEASNAEGSTEANEASTEANEASTEANEGQEEEEEEEYGEEEEGDIMDQIELEDSGVDDVMSDEILMDELGPMEEEEEEEENEMSATVALKKKKIASSKVQTGGVGNVNEDMVLSALMQELSV